MMLRSMVCASILLSTACALPLNTPLLPSYDYIIVGGGPSGLTVANRLSEDPDVNVLLLEAGPADIGEDIVTIPGFIGHDIGGQYDWNLSTEAQTFLDGNARSLPQGRALGGGTLLNGMLWSRGGQQDYADWVALGNPGWSWDDLLPYFQKSETFTPMRDQSIAEQYSVRENASVHGYAGPVNVSFPNYQWNASITLFAALAELGVPTSYDPNAGDVAGASFLPFDLDPVTQTRCTARRAYYDSVAHRPNLWVATGQTVTQVLFNGAQGNSDASVAAPSDMSVGQGASPASGGIFGDGSMLNVSSVPARLSSTSATATTPPSLARRLWGALKRNLPRFRRQVPGPYLIATGVEFAPDAQGLRQTIRVTREVILAAGAVHTPQILMLSGLGPANDLRDLGIQPLIDLPGVGNNLMDHMQVWTWYPYHDPYTTNPTILNTNQTFVDSAWHDYWTTRTGPFTSGAIDGVAFPSLPHITSTTAAVALASLARAQDPRAFLPNGTNPTILAGYGAQLSLLAAALQTPSRAAYELINSNDGALSLATMRPLSRGSITLASSLPFTPPLIDPRYGSNPVDLSVLLAAIHFNARLINTTAMQRLAPLQIYPPVDSTDNDLLQYIRNKAQTEYHYSGTAAMLPLSLGGVVDAELRVYGTGNLRVVDSSIFPLVPAAHLQAVVYAVAERAADLIKAGNGASAGMESAGSLPDAGTAGVVVGEGSEASSVMGAVGGPASVVPEESGTGTEVAASSPEESETSSATLSSTTVPPSTPPAPVTDVVLVTTWVTVYTR